MTGMIPGDEIQPMREDGVAAIMLALAATEVVITRDDFDFY
jgi:hypothetical protein